MGEKGQKTGSNRTNIGERNEAPPPPPILIKPGPRLTEGKIYVAVFCVDVNGDINRLSSGGWKRAPLFRKCDVC